MYSKLRPLICRPKGSLGTRTVSDSLRLQVTGEQPAADLQGSDAATTGEDFEGNGASGGSSAQPGARPEELGNSRGKRMAMKFVNKIASKEKYTQVRKPISGNTVFPGSLSQRSSLPGSSH